MSKSSITPYVGATGGGLLATVATGAGTVGIAGAGGAFALPFLPALGILGLAGWALGQAVDAFLEPAPAPRKVVNVTPVTEVTETIEPIRTVMSSSMQDDVLDVEPAEEKPLLPTTADGQKYFSTQRLDQFSRTGTMPRFTTYVSVDGSSLHVRF